MNKSHKSDFFLCAEDAVKQDLSESYRAFKQIAASLYPNKSMEQAIWLLRKKIDGDCRSILGLQETIGLLKIAGCEENTVRYLCLELGYNMPDKIFKDEEQNIAEEEIIKLDEELEELHKQCSEKMRKRQELITKIKRVK